MRRFSEHLDYLPLMPGGPIDTVHANKAPCNEIVAAVVAIAASVASSVISYQNAEDQAKQAEYNAEAQNEALKVEADRQQAEMEANRRRTMLAQKRARSQQLAQIADSGFMTGTGTTLEIEADTWNKQQLELADMSYYNQLNQRELAFRGQTALAMGAQQASQLRAQKAGIIAGGIGDVAGMGMKIGASGGFGGNDGQPSKGTGSPQLAAPAAQTATK